MYIPLPSTKTKGFTLIEMLIVVVIIGILAAALITRLRSAEDRAKYVTITAKLKEVHTNASIFYTDFTTYQNLCTQEVIKQSMNDIIHFGGKASCYTHADFQETSFAVAGSYDKRHFSAFKNGVLVFDETNQSSTNSWTNGMTVCQNAGKILPPIDALKALWDAAGGMPTGFPNPPASYWSIYEDETDTSRAWNISSNGTLSRTTKTGNRGIRCVKPL